MWGWQEEEGEVNILAALASIEAYHEMRLVVHHGELLVVPRVSLLSQWYEEMNREKWNRTEMRWWLVQSQRWLVWDKQGKAPCTTMVQGGEVERFQDEEMFEGGKRNVREEKFFASCFSESWILIRCEGVRWERLESQERWREVRGEREVRGRWRKVKKGEERWRKVKKGEERWRKVRGKRGERKGEGRGGRRGERLIIP
jgi:hypothetical protein